MDELRIFDALNDPRNLETAIKATLAAGKTARGEICYTLSPVHTIEAFVEFAQKLVDMGCHSISIKDMAGLIAPDVAYKLVKQLKERFGLPVILHSHDTAGLAATSYCAAVEAGVDRIETSISPFANGSAQPDTARMLVLLKGSPRCPEYDEDTLHRLREHFQSVYQELDKFTKRANERVDSDILRYQIPGGMLSNFLNQLEEQKMSDKLPEVMKEIAHVRQCLGYIPLVTPTSQIVGTQAMMNVKFGRWKMVSQPTSDVVLGKYGKTPGPIDEDLKKQVLKQTKEDLVECRPADLLEPGMDKLRKDLEEKGLPVSDEMAVLYAMFPQEVLKLHEHGNHVHHEPASREPHPVTAAGAGPSKEEMKRPASVIPPVGKPCVMELTVNQKTYHVTVEDV
jgi:oxaloacetate decarboxylase alpha subunit/pyruvate carboxylase subunit B